MSGDPRPTELIDRAQLGAFLRSRGLIEEGPLTVTRIGSGHSNPTFLVAAGGREVVVRRPPAPPLPPSAHDVLREARALAAVAPGPDGGVPVPVVLAVCEDDAVLGVPFYVMERLVGDVIVDEVPAHLSAESDRRAIGHELIDTLVDLHALDWRGRGLDGFGRPTGYLERQLRRFSAVWVENRTRELPLVERVGEWLERRMPTSVAASVVHGDYRLGNVMFADSSPTKLIGVFDWEMATIGDPLADLGYLMAFWVMADDPPLKIFELSRATRSSGFCTRGELIRRYEQRSGRRVESIGWYEALAMWKLAILMEGNYKRASVGTIDDPYLREFGPGVLELAERAAELAGIRVTAAA